MANPNDMIGKEIKYGEGKTGIITKIERVFGRFVLDTKSLIVTGQVYKARIKPADGGPEFWINNIQM